MDHAADLPQAAVIADDDGDDLGLGIAGIQSYFFQLLLHIGGVLP